MAVNHSYGDEEYDDDFVIFTECIIDPLKKKKWKYTNWEGSIYYIVPADMIEWEDEEEDDNEW